MYAIVFYVCALFWHENEPKNKVDHIALYVCSRCIHSYPCQSSNVPVD